MTANYSAAQVSAAAAYDAAEMATLIESAATASTTPVHTAAVMAVLTSSDNTSTKIRKLLAIGLSRAAVAKALNIRYQHVRNVELTPLKRA